MTKRLTIGAAGIRSSYQLAGLESYVRSAGASRPVVIGAAGRTGVERAIVAEKISKIATHRWGIKPLIVRYPLIDDGARLARRRPQFRSSARASALREYLLGVDGHAQAAWREPVPNLSDAEELIGVVARRRWMHAQRKAGGTVL